MNDHQVNTDGMMVYRRLLSYATPFWKVLLLAIFGMVIYALTEGAFAKLIEPMLDGSFVKKDPETIKWVPVLMVLAFTIRIFGSFLSEYGMAWIARSVIRDLRSLVFDKLLTLPVSYYDISSSGTLLSKMVYDIEQVAEATSSVVTILIRDSLTVIVLIGLMLYLSVTLTLMLLIVTPFIALMVVYVSKRFRTLSKRIQGSMGGVSDITEEVIQGNREIKIFGSQKFESEKFSQVNQYNRHQHLKLAATNALSSPIIQLIVVVAFALIVYMATQPEFVEAMTVGKFMSFMLAMILLLQHAKRLTTVNVTLQRGIAAAQSVFDFIDLQDEIDDGTQILPDVKGKVNFKQVDFSYNGSEKILNNINLMINPGDTVAFVGRSGAGKSSLVNLLPRFYDNFTGTIELDDVDIKQLSLKDLRKHIALVSQNVTLFNDTIAHNISYASVSDGVTDEDLQRAAKAAHALEFIDKLPDGMNTFVGEDGVLLSGGQRQRIAIARAILKDAPILILDEATSALDTESERHIQSALDELMKSRTTLVIAHRLSTIENADKIVVLEKGNIVEAGKHKELLELNGHYAGLHRMQFRDSDDAEVNNSIG